MTTPDELRAARLMMANTAYATALRLLLGALTENAAITPPALQAKLAPALTLAAKVMRAANNTTDDDLRAVIDASKPAKGTIH